MKSMAAKKPASLLIALALVLSLFSGIPMAVFADDAMDRTPLGISITSADSFTCTAGTGGAFQVTAKGAENIEYTLDGGVRIDGETGLLTVDADVPVDEQI